MKVFVIAMASEAEAVLANMEEKTQSPACGKIVTRGTLCGTPVAVVICGVGKVNAACGAQYAADCLNADAIINIGVAGGLNGGTAVGEIYGIESAAQYDFDLAQLNGTAVGTLNEFSQPYLPLATLPLYPLKKLGSGDRFNDSPADFELLTKELGADIRDMECAAMAQACAHAGVKLYSFKAISDVAGSGSTTEQYLKNLERCNARLKEAVPAIFKGVMNG